MRCRLQVWLGSRLRLSVRVGASKLLLTTGLMPCSWSMIDVVVTLNAVHAAGLVHSCVLGLHKTLPLRADHWAGGFHERKRTIGRRLSCAGAGRCCSSTGRRGKFAKGSAGYTLEVENLVDSPVNVHSTSKKVNTVE